MNASAATAPLASTPVLDTEWPVRPQPIVVVAGARPGPPRPGGRRARAIGRWLLQITLPVWSALLLAAAPPSLALERPKARAAASLEADDVQRWSQLTTLSFEHLRQQDGLPHDIVRVVAQDGDGFMWMGTPIGVARWDGYRFRVFKADARSNSPVPDSYVQALIADSAGRIWIGTAASGLMRYDRDADRFIAYPAGPKGLSDMSVRSIVDDGHGGVWVGTDSGLDHVDGATGVVTQGVTVMSGPDRPAHTRVRSVMRDRRGGLWVGTQAGLFRRADGSERFEQVPLSELDGTPLEPTVTFEDSAGHVWIGTARNGLYWIERPGEPAWPFRESPRPPRGDSMEFSSIGAFIEARPGEIWVSAYGLGVVTIDVPTRQTRLIRNIATLPSSLPDDTIHSLARDRSGLVWACSNHGASRHDPRQSAVLNIYGKPPAAADNRPAPVRPAAGRSAAERLLPERPAPELPLIASTNIGAVLALGPHSVWLGTSDGNIFVIDPSGARTAELRADSARPLTALPKDYVLSMDKAADGSVYIGTRRGVYRASADARKVSRVTVGPRDVNASTATVLADGGSLWIGGEFDGLWRLDLRSGRGERAPMQPGQQLSTQRLSTLGRGEAGTIWVGSHSGLNRYDPQHGTVLQIATAPGAPAALSNGYVTSIFTDRSGHVWIATYGGGISLLEPDSAPAAPRFRHFTTANGLHDDYVNAITQDHQGHVWFSTDSGLATIDPDTGATQVLGRADGVAFGTYWTTAAATTSEGELLFGGAGGLTIVRPERLQNWSYRPQTVVSELRIGAQTVPPERYFGPRAATSVALAAPLQIQPDSNQLSVEFASTDYSAPERNRYAYRLEGFDADWIDTPAKRRLAAYTSLPPGPYRLLLRASNREGVWSDDVLALPIRVLPAWYETAWFRALAVLAALLVLALIVQARTHLLRKQREQLERMVDERTIELRDMSRALQEKSRVLELTSISDPLTGLRNRRFLTQHIDTEVNASLRRSLDFASGNLIHPVDTDTVFLVIDIDHFKRVNDAYGHTAGDQVLVQFAQRLQVVMREADYVVRWGGEEFLAVARNTDRGRAEELAERLRTAVSETPFHIEGGRSLSMSCSIGWACLPFIEHEPRALDWQDVIKLADMALMAAKRAGRNAWVGMHAAAAVRAEGLMARLGRDPQTALRQGEIALSSNRPGEVLAQALVPPAAAPLSGTAGMAGPASTPGPTAAAGPGPSAPAGTH